MSRWNHFAKRKYRKIQFDSVQIGKKFRKDCFDGKGKRRPDIIMVKTGSLTYQEWRSKKNYTVGHSDFDVSHISKKN